MGVRRAAVAVGVVWALAAAGALRCEAQRLPGGVQPRHYALTITPDLARARFEGTEKIDVVLDAPASAITLNAAEIEFGAVRAATENKANPEAPTIWQDATVALDSAKEQATLTFARPLAAGPVTLEIAFKGTLNDKLRGFYLSKTKTRRYGVTQFEATDARRAFPCFDEPALKATFDVTLVVDVGDTAISNTQMVKDTPGPGPGKHTIAFATTPKMSTYLVAWLVGDFVCSEGRSDGVPLRVCATPDKAGLTKFALEAAKWDLHYYDKYFGIKYPMTKLDLVAIPDFEAGAMENFGCITFRETELLVDSKNGTLPARKEVATTVAHEIAHQWFGDLVTPQWWDNLWLNEGFATWMETKAAAKWRPKWAFEQDQAMEHNGILDEDAAGTTRPIRERAETPAEINELFDDIAYGKAGAVIAMVENWVGEEAFRRGVQAYLAAHLYGSATAEDFWSAQARVSGLPVDRVMRSFVEQPGVPEVIFGGAQGSGIAVTQRRFIEHTAESQESARGAGSATTDGTSASAAEGVWWTIPLCMKRDGCKLLTPQTAEIKGAAKGRFFYANAGDKGYYRTEYSRDEFAEIVANAETGLAPAERIGLLGDRWALMRAGQGTVGEFLDLALAVKHDKEATVADSALGRVSAIGSRIATDEDRVRLDAVVRREYGPVYLALGGPRRHESEDHAELRETLFEALGEARDPAVLAEAEALTQQLFSGEKPADPMIVDAAVALAAAKGDATMYDRLLRVVHETKDPDFRAAALRALTWFEAPELVRRTLEYAVSDEMRSQDSWGLIARLLSRRETQEEAWAFVKQHWGEIERRSTESSGSRIVEAAGAFCTVEKREEVASFFGTHPVESAERTLAKSLDRIHECVQLRAAQEPELRRWLDAHGGS